MPRDVASARASLSDNPMGFACSRTLRSPSRRQSMAASSLAVVDWDVHHGNGTQAIYYDALT
jgi:acetoin utilization deacetylase AcuC-like enzyme